MSTLLSSPPGTGDAPPSPRSTLPFPGLVSAELYRLRIRPLVLAMFLGYFVLLLVTFAMLWLRYEPYDAAGVTRDYENALGNCLRGMGEAAEAGGIPSAAVRSNCEEGVGASAAEFGAQAEIYPNFFAHVHMPLGMSIASLTFAAVAFLVGATYIGADWSAKTLPGLLTWEPRRGRLLLAKLLALIGTVVPVAALAQIAHLGVLSATAHFRGTFASTPGDFWITMGWQMGRGVVLAALLATAGFALATALRHTAAPLAVAFLYVVIFEGALSWPPQWWTPWALSNTIRGWLTPGGYSVEMGEYVEVVDPTTGIPEVIPVVVHMSNAWSGLFLLAVCLVLVATSIAVFRSRDIA